MTKDLRFVLFGIWIAFAMHVQGQIVADFTIAPSAGCAPLVVQFNDASSGNVVYREWIFGNGNVNIGNNMAPSAVYSGVGSYTVTLIISDGIDTATIVKNNCIQVFAPPTSSFSLPSTVVGCAPFDLQLVNNAVANGAPIQSVEWDFDDGSPTLNSNLGTHTYLFPGVYGVTQIVTDTLGCSSSMNIPLAITVLESPIANFSYSTPVTACQPPLPVNLVNTSTSISTATYFWQVGLDTASTYNYSDTILANGSYDVSLTVTNALGCADTLMVPDYIHVGTVQAGMSIPDTVCVGEDVTMSSTTLTSGVLLWDFGDGGTASGVSVNHSYASSGTYTVTLIASSGAGCNDTISQSIVVDSVQAAFTSTPHFACEPGLLVNFTDQSVGNIVAWEWHFGQMPNGCTNCGSNISTVQNPSNVYNSPGYYNDTLIVTSAAGCQSSVVVLNNEFIHVIEPNFSPSVISGCGPLSVNFTNTSTPIDSIDQIFWDFDDGSPTVTTLNSSHVFTLPGEYNVQMTITSVSGCVTFVTKEIQVGTPQVSNFTVNSLVACASDTVSFTNLSSDTNLIDEYLWSFGDGTSSSDYEPGHQFIDTGYMHVSLVVSYNGCPDTLSLDSAIYINGPYAELDVIVNCDTPNIIDFDPTILGGNAILWDFDNGVVDSLNWSPTHEFAPVDSNYDVFFQVRDTNTGCSFEINQLIAIRFMDGVLDATDTNICKNDQVFFTTANSINTLGTVYWNNGGVGAYSLGTNAIDYVFSDTGQTTVYVEISDINGCKDTLSQNIYVHEPNALFTVTPASGCAPLVVQFQDGSQSDTNIVNWVWNFGDGGASNLQNPSYVYNGNGNQLYDVSLMVTDAYGCSNTLELFDVIEIQEPPSFFDALSTNICVGSTITFFDVPSGNYTYFWDFGDGGTSTTFQPQHTYNTSGVFTVSLTVTNSQGCDSTYVQPNFVSVQDYPVADFFSTSTSVDCYPATIQFFDTANNPLVNTWIWNFGDSPSDVTRLVPNAQNVYNGNGVYDVSLVVITSFGCADTITKPQYIEVNGPEAQISINPEISCFGDVVTFNVQNSNSITTDFTWDYGDGVVATFSGNPVPYTHTYTSPGNYLITLVYSDSSGNCIQSDSLNISVVQVTAEMQLIKADSCVPSLVTLVDQSNNSNSREWYVNGALVGSNMVKNLNISIPGDYVIHLVEIDSFSQCKDTTSNFFTIYPLPVVEALPDTTLCIGDFIQLQVTGANTFQWFPTDFLNNAAISNPISTPLGNVSYVVEGVDSNACVNSDTVYIEVQQKPELNYISPDTFIFLGEYFPISTVSNFPLLYTWSPAATLNCQNCPDPMAEPKQPTTYLLTYSDEHSCFVMDTTIFIDVLDEFSIYVPNAFTPNLDGNNDTFKPILFGVEKLVSFHIYDRWGMQVFETDDYNLGWDGRVNGEIASHNAIFSYKVIVQRYTGEQITKTGMVVLISK